MATATHMQHTGTTKSITTGGTTGAQSHLARGAQPASPPQAETRACPTRDSGPAPLFQHQVTTSQCQSKQRGLYHKCFTCSHANGR